MLADLVVKLIGSAFISTTIAASSSAASDASNSIIAANEFLAHREQNDELQEAGPKSVEMSYQINALQLRPAEKLRGQVAKLECQFGG